MRNFYSLHKTFFLLLIIFWAASCTQKAKTEQPVEKPDSVAQTAPKIESQPKQDSVVVEKPVEKREEKPALVEKKNSKIAPVKPEIKQEPAKQPVVEPAKEPVKEKTKEPVAIAPPVKEPVVVAAPVRPEEKKEPTKIQPAKIDSSSIKKPEAKVKGKPYYFKVVSKADGKEIFGNLQLQEGVGASQFQLIKSGEIVYIEEPKNRRGTYNVVALIPGYRQSSLVFGYFNPPISTGPKSEEIITLTLDKARAGDYVDFNNVHFFKNTSIMRPVSQAELDELASLLKENQNYRIKIYGYCNGTQERESYTMGTSENFFAMDPKTNKKETISSKALSVARAENVKNYLVKQGVNPSRISIKGEGGKVPLYSESGTLAQYNDRIEVEFVKN